MFAYPVIQSHRKSILWKNRLVFMVKVLCLGPLILSYVFSRNQSSSILIGDRDRDMLPMCFNVSDSSYMEDDIFEVHVKGWGSKKTTWKERVIEATWWEVL